MKKFDDFKKWLKRIKNGQILRTVRNKPYSLSLDQQCILFNVHSTNNIRPMQFLSVEAIFNRYQKNGREPISHYQSKRHGQVYTMSASYIIPLLDRYFRKK